MGLYASPRLLLAGDGAVLDRAGRRYLARRQRADASSACSWRRGCRGWSTPSPRFARCSSTTTPSRFHGRRWSRRSASSRPGWRTRRRRRGAGWSSCAYGGTHGPDLDEVARRLDLTPAEVVRLHAGAEHYVYFVGFTPGLPYMAGQPAADHPAARPPANQDPARQRRDRRHADLHLLGGEPGRLLACSGRTPLRLYDPGAPDPILLRAGDHVRFEPIEPAEYDTIAAAVAAGGYRPRIEEAR